MKVIALYGIILLTGFAARTQSLILRLDHLGTQDGLSDNSTRAVGEDADHNLWIGTDSGLNFYDGFSITEYNTVNSALGSELIRTLCFSSEGTLVIHTAARDRVDKAEGMYVIADGDTIKRLPGFDGTPFTNSLDISQFYKDAFYHIHDGSLWKYSVKDDAWTHVRLPEGFQGEYVIDGFVTGMAGDKHAFVFAERNNEILDAKDLWSIDTSFATLYQLKDRIEDFGGKLHLARYDKERKVIWIAAKHEVTVIDQHGNIVSCTPDGQPIRFERGLEYITLGRDGLVFFSTNEGFAFGRVERGNFRKYTLSAENRTMFGITSQATRGLCVADSNLYINMDDVLVRQSLRRDAKQHVVFDSPSGKLFPLYLDGDVIWTGRQMLVRHDLKSGESQVISTTLPDYISGLWSMYHTGDRFYLGGQSGTRVMDYQALLQGRMEPFCVRADSNLYRLVYQYVETTAGLIYVTSRGLYRAIQDNCAPEQIPFLYPDGERPIFNNCTHLYEDRDSTWWVATQDGGVIHCKWVDDSAVILNVLDREDGLTTNTCYAVYPDHSGSAWIATDQGLIRLNTKDWSFRVFTTEDGLTDNEFNRISHYRDATGNLYFGGLKGVVALTPEDFYPAPSDDIPLRLLNVSQFIAWDDTIVDMTAAVSATGRAVFHPGDKFIRFEVGLADLFRTKDQRYEYRMTGVYDDWEPMIENILSINMLPYGTHDLEIRARNADGMYSRHTLSIEIEARRPFYLRIWFIAMVVGGLILVIREYWISKTRRERERAERLEEVVQQRTATISEQADALRDLQQMRSRFFANISHELRTPLTLIRGPVQSLLKNAEQSSDARAYLHLIEQNAETLGERIDDLLLLSRMDARQLRIQNEDFRLKPFLERSMDGFGAATSDKSISLEFDNTTDPGLCIRTDKKKLEHIVANYLSNAIKFTPAGGLVVMRCGRENDFLVICVEDNGPGIGPEDAPKVFDRFYQAKSLQHVASGTGIGLAICKELAEMLGGNVSLDTRLEKGSTFCVRIPFVEVSPTLTDNTEGNDVVIAPQEVIATRDPELMQTQSGSILLVEDNDALRDFLCNELREYKLSCAGDGKQGIEMLQEMHVTATLPDCIISDVMMPVMDGFEMVTRIKQDPILNHIPVIMLTARAGLEDKLTGLRIGVDDYISKPFDMEELKARIANILSRIPAKREENTPQDALTGVDQEWLMTLEQRVLENLSRTDFTMDQLADSMFISRRQMYRKIKLYTGLAANAYVREVRLFEARKLLEQRAVSTVAELSYAVGFEDPDYFSRIYNERFGYRPSRKIGEG